MFLRF